MSERVENCKDPIHRQDAAIAEADTQYTRFTDKTATIRR